MKNVSLVALLSTATLLLATLGTAVATQSAKSIQDDIDKATLGDVVYVPEGTYEGAIVLKNGVSLIGSPEGETIIIGPDGEIAISGASDAILSNLIITGGKIGVETRGAFMGIFDCSFHGYDSTAIHVTGGSAVIVNNIVAGGAISCNSANPLIICNTIVTADTDGLWSWYGPGPVAINNLIVGARHAVVAGAGSVASLDTNAFWANEATDSGAIEAVNSIFTDPFFVDPEEGDISLSPSSPLVGAGKAIEGLWNGETPDVGWNAGRRYSAEECRAFMDLVAPDLVPDTPIVVYTLGDTPGEFLVTTKHPINRFTVCSSTAHTPITDIDAFDKEDEDALTAQLIEEEYPLVKVESEAPLPAPAEAIENRYIMKSTYHSDESYYDDEGLRIFKRKTNFPTVIVEIPDGYNAIRALKNGLPIDGELSEVIEIPSPGVKEIEIVMQRTTTAPSE